MSSHLECKIKEDKEWLYSHAYGPMAIILNVITLGAYGWMQCGNYMRRVGLL